MHQTCTELSIEAITIVVLTTIKIPGNTVYVVANCKFIRSTADNADDTKWMMGTWMHNMWYQRYQWETLWSSC